LSAVSNYASDSSREIHEPEEENPMLGFKDRKSNGTNKNI